MTETAKTSVGTRRRQKGAPKASQIKAPAIDPDELGPASFAIKDIEPAERQEDVQFDVDDDKLKYLHFTEPGAKLPSKRLYTIKAFDTSGTLVQIPFADQIQNTAGGSREDAIGLRRYERKGFKLLWDFETMLPVYCAAWGCWAQATKGNSFCSPQHGAATFPEGDTLGNFSTNATTTRTARRVG